MVDGFVPVDLTPFEAEHFVSCIDYLDIETIGDSAFLDQHEKVDKLSNMAHYQAEDKVDEYVVDYINTHDKLSTLIHNLIVVETWKQHVFPHVKSHVAQLSSLRSYIPLFAEASLVSLVEMCLYHSTSCETAGDSLVDLIDYVYRKLTYLVCTPNSELYSAPLTSTEEALAKTDVMLLDEQKLDMEFQICCSAMNICRYMTDHRQHLPLTLTTRLLDTHDILLTLCPLMEKAPWVRKRRGNFEKFEKSEWKVIHEDDLCTLPKLSSQLWLTIFNLVMDPQCRARYEIKSHRKENLLRLRRFLNEVLFDQIPPLTELLRTLEELSITGQYTQGPTLPGQKNLGDTISNAFLVELVAEVREALLANYRGRWEEIGKKQIEKILTKETPEEIKRLQTIISMPRLEEEDEDLTKDLTKKIESQMEEALKSGALGEDEHLRAVSSKIKGDTTQDDVSSSSTKESSNDDENAEEMTKGEDKNAKGDDKATEDPVAKSKYAAMEELDDDDGPVPIVETGLDDMD